MLTSIGPNNFKESGGGSNKRKRRKTLAGPLDIFREVSKVRPLRKNKAVFDAEEEHVDANHTGELVADHEWGALIDTFEPDGEAPVASTAEEDELWERLSSTRWLKSTPPSDGENDSDVM